MTSLSRALRGSLFIGLLLLMSVLGTVNVSAARLSRTVSNHGVSYQYALARSPLSTGLLMAQAVHSGKIHLPNRGIGHPVVNPNLTCSPAPCVLPNVQASEGGQPVNEDPIVVNPANNSQVLTGGNDYNCPNIQGFYASGDGGTTWNHTCMNALSGASGNGDPGVGYDLNSTAYITGIDTGTPDGSDIVFEKSTNNGTTWSAPAIAVKPFFSGGLTDKDWLQIDTNASSPHKNALYVSVTQFDASRTHDTISVSHSTNGGSTWTTVQVDATQTLSTQVDQFSDLAVGKDGTVYVSWLRCPPIGLTSDCGGTASKMYFSKSTNGGNTWSAPVVEASVTLAPDSCGAFYGCLPNTNERVSDIPAIDVDNSSGPHAGHLYTAMYNWTGTFMQVEVVNSADSGSTWSAPVLVAPPSDTHDQFFPWLTVSGTGVIGVTWLDRRNDPSNISYEAFAATSTKGGASFGKNVKIATKPSNPNHDGFGGSFMGDYTGNFWGGKTLCVSWMDSRGGRNMQDEVGGLTSLLIDQSGEKLSGC